MNATVVATGASVVLGSSMVQLYVMARGRKPVSYPVNWIGLGIALLGLAM